MVWVSHIKAGQVLRQYSSGEDVPGTTATRTQNVYLSVEYLFAARMIPSNTGLETIAT